ncbi:TonB-dependent receptor-like protein [Edaphobacter modestus]|uniref:TonB-dependent receptor-like protein n=2 Tax=Edaphobacter modestus TaxID=388466 RepID=A0A4Q7YQE4_9BACT|nr:TonB-dependent receptor-like protein [Edaphobacter modestus]
MLTFITVYVYVMPVREINALSHVYSRAIKEEATMQKLQYLDSGRAGARLFGLLLALFLCMFPVGRLLAQVDQGAVTGIVMDPSGGVIPGATVTLTSIETGLVLQQTTNSSGIYTFQPVKIGSYKVSATASGFAATTQENLKVNIQARLSVNLSLKPGGTSETVTVSTAPPLLETQTGAIGQVVEAKTINETPLNGRNWVFIAQLTNGVTPSLGNTRGSAKGDFIANGQRATQNNFVLDGVDNNTNLVDFLNGSTFVQRPPPDALAEFNIQTSNYSAEFGHSAGAVMNASIKSGTNRIHGNLWEYYRSDKMNARDWNALTVPRFHQNQFGATIGFPILKDKLFYFGDVEANRISNANVNNLSVPSVLERQGNFSELLNPAISGFSQAIHLKQPNTNGTVALGAPCGRAENVMCAADIDANAQNILNMYPLPNRGNTLVNNYVLNVPRIDSTTQFDHRVDWNISPKDLIYGRFSYVHQIVKSALPLGPVLDGSGYGGYIQSNLAENGMGSYTHTFSPSIVNEFRFGYNWGVFNFETPNGFNGSIAGSLGFGNVPCVPGFCGLPLVQIGGSVGISQFGSTGTSRESQNVYQILDNLTFSKGKHSIKYGVAFQNVRFYYTYADSPRGNFTFNGHYTKIPGTSLSSGVADFLTGRVANAYITNAPGIHDQQWYNSAYAQDDWRLTSKLTLNIGLRWDFYQPLAESRDRQANFLVTGPVGQGTGSGAFQLPSSLKSTALAPNFVDTLAASNVQLQYVDNNRLVTSQKTNFAPRVGFSYQANEKTVFRGGIGIFYGGLESNGNGNLGANYPFSLSQNFPEQTCDVGNCSTSFPYTLASGLPTLTPVTAATSYPGFHSTDAHIQTPYTENYSFSMQYALSNNLVSSIAYVGNETRHLTTYFAQNSAVALYRNGLNTQPLLPFPTLGGIGATVYTGYSSYNSLQAKLEKRFSSGLNFLATYTWAHAMDNSSSSGGLSTAVGTRAYYMLGGPNSEYTNSSYDVRNRITFNGHYELPWGRGRRFLKNNRALDFAVGGWEISNTFTAQSGTPFGMSTTTANVAGASARPVLVTDPFRPGEINLPGTKTGCPTQVKTRDHWYNPCAFAEPMGQLDPGNLICAPGVAPGNGCRYASGVTDPSLVAQFLGGKQNLVYGPGYWRNDVSLFKNFPVWHEQTVQFRADIFNVFNHPTWGNPSVQNNDPASGGQIQGPKNFGANTPDARFIQLAAKYYF